MLRYSLIHPPLLAALGAAGHGARVLIADANYSHGTNVGRYRELLGPELELEPLGRLEFYAACREPDLAVCVATGDDRLYANVLLTIGYVRPGG